MPHLIILGCILEALAALQPKLDQMHDFLESEVARDAFYTSVQNKHDQISDYMAARCTEVQAFIDELNVMFPSNPQGED